MDCIKFEDILTDRIGCDCYYKSLSCLLQNAKKLYLSLDYIKYNFIYDFVSITSFNTDFLPKSYLEDTDTTLFAKSPQSRYLTDYYDTIDLGTSEALKSGIGFKNFDICSYDVQIENFNEKFWQYGKSVALLLDSYVLAPDYQKIGIRYSHFHTDHFVNVFGLNVDKDTCYIVDNYFEIKGEIQLKSLKKAMEPTKYFTSSPSGLFLDLSNPLFHHDDDNEKNIIIDKFLNCALTEDTIVNGFKYKKGTVALNSYIADFPQIINSMYDKFGIYTPQYISYPTMAYRHQVQSIAPALKSASDIILSPIIDMFLLLSKEWIAFDYMLDIIALKQQDIRTKTDNLMKRLHIIQGLDHQIMDEVRRLQPYYKSLLK